MLTWISEAKPMGAPDVKEALRVPLIVVARYLEYRSPATGISYFDAPTAHYRIEKVLKGKPITKELWVYYSFHDGSACIAPPDFKFLPAMMPRKDSRWLLFLQPVANTNKWTTYRGNWGRQAESQAVVISKFLR